MGIQLTALQSSPKIEAIESAAKEIGAKCVSSAPVEFFTAHEAMQLDLEEALTRPVGDEYYNLSAHLLWIGDRTRQLDNAHVEYFRGISNPIGCKIGPSMKAEELQELVKVLNPNKEEGRLTLITRYGAGKVEEMLPTHIEAVKATGVPVVWQCDAVHRRCGSILGGIHLEATGQETVTECLGGSVGLTEDMLRLNYETVCDPRLNYAQSIETAFEVAEASLI